MPADHFKPPAGQNMETAVVPSKKQRGFAADEKATSTGSKSQKASYTPTSNINELSYGGNGGKAAFANPPSVVVGGLCESQNPPAMPGNLVIGDDKNVSTPVSGA